MLTNVKRVYTLAEGWFFTRTARFDDKPEWRGPYSSLASVALMIARELKRELTKRDAPYTVE
jgi:hypothetical protein